MKPTHKTTSKEKSFSYFTFYGAEGWIHYRPASNRSEVKKKLEMEDTNKMRTAASNLQLLNFVSRQMHHKPKWCNSDGIYH